MLQLPGSPHERAGIWGTALALHRYQAPQVTHAGPGDTSSVGDGVGASLLRSPREEASVASGRPPPSSARPGTAAVSVVQEKPDDGPSRYGRHAARCPRRSVFSAVGAASSCEENSALCSRSSGLGLGPQGVPLPSFSGC